MGVRAGLSEVASTCAAAIDAETRAAVRVGRAGRLVGRLGRWNAARRVARSRSVAGRDAIRGNVAGDLGRIGSLGWIRRFEVGQVAAVQIARLLRRRGLARDGGLDRARCGGVRGGLGAARRPVPLGRLVRLRHVVGARGVTRKRIAALGSGRAAADEGTHQSSPPSAIDDRRDSRDVPHEAHLGGAGEGAPPERNDGT